MQKKLSQNKFELSTSILAIHSQSSNFSKCHDFMNNFYNKLVKKTFYKQVFNKQNQINMHPIPRSFYDYFCIKQFAFEKVFHNMGSYMHMTLLQTCD